jgi:phosphoserine phosphatase
MSGDGVRAEEPAGDSKKAAAFFDLDKTLMAGSSGMHFARAAARTEIGRASCRERVSDIV